MVPTNILICITPDEKILGNSFVKNFLIGFVNFIIGLIFGIKYFRQ